MGLFSFIDGLDHAKRQDSWLPSVRRQAVECLLGAFHDLACVAPVLLARG